MNELKSQEIDIIDIQDITYIFFQPFSEYYYSYSINNVDNYHIVERSDIPSLLQKVMPSFLHRKAESYYTRFFSFIYVKELNTIEVLEKEEIESHIGDILKEKLIDKSLEKETSDTFSNLKDLASSLYSNTIKKLNLTKK